MGPLQIVCPRCRALVGKRCRSVTGSSVNFCKARIEAAKKTNKYRRNLSHRIGLRAYYYYQMAILWALLEDSFLARNYFKNLLELHPRYPRNYLQLLNDWIQYLETVSNIYRRNPPTEEEKKIYDWLSNRFTDEEVKRVLNSTEQGAFNDFRDKLQILISGRKVSGRENLTERQLVFVKGICRKLYDARTSKVPIEAPIVISDREKQYHESMIYSEEEIKRALNPKEQEAYYDFKNKLETLIQGKKIEGKYRSLNEAQLKFIEGLIQKIENARKGITTSRIYFGPSKLDGRCQICNNKYLKDTVVHQGTWTHQHCFENLKINLPARFDPASPEFIPPSPYQEAIRQQYLTSNTHIIIDAKAGSGKTTTLEWLVCTTYDKSKHVLMVAFNRSIRTELKERINRAKLINVEAFTLNGYGFSVLRKTYPEIDIKKWKVSNKKIKILAERSGWGPEGRGFPTNIEDIKDRYQITDPQAIQNTLKRNKILKNALVELTDKVRQNLATPDQYKELITKYQISLEDLPPQDEDLICALVPELLDLDVKAVEEEALIDYIDQNWIPVAKLYQIRTKNQIVLDKTMGRLRPPKHYDVDIMYVDESQDLNRCQAEFSLMCVGRRGRLIVVGDPFQSIYAFAGADSQSMRRLAQILSTTPRGCSKMPLSISWRCPITTIQLAQGILEPLLESGDTNIEARPDAGIGKILELKPQEVLQSLTLTDAELHNGKIPVMFLSRTNAALFEFAFRVLAQNIPVKIQGRDICKNIKDYLDDINPQKRKVVNQDLAVLLNVIVKRRLEIQELLRASDQNFDLELDKLAVIEMFATKPEATNVDSIKASLDEMFASGSCPECGQEADADEKHCPRCIEDTEERPGKIIEIVLRAGILFSTVHKAKGLEALRVYLLQPSRLGKARREASDEEKRQEQHIYYVAVTRTMYHKKAPETSGILVYVSEEEGPLPQERRDYHPSEYQPKSEENFEEDDEMKEILEEREKLPPRDLAAELTSPVELPLSEVTKISSIIKMPVGIRSLNLPQLPSKGSGLFQEPSLDDWIEIRNLYRDIGIPAKLIRPQGWAQYGLVVNGVALASTTVNIGGLKIRRKGILALRVMEPDSHGRFVRTPLPAIQKGLKTLTIKRTVGWKGRIIEAINEILLRRSATSQEIDNYEAFPEAVNQRKRLRRFRSS